MFARAIGGEKIIFDRMILGDGGYSGDLQAVEAVISPKAEVPVRLAERVGGKVVLEGILALKDVEAPFYWREIGAYARAGEEHCLCVYGNAQDKGDYIAPSGGTLDEKIIRLAVQAGDGEILADPSSLVYVTAGELAAAEGKLSAHAGNADIHVTAEQKTTWDGKAPGSLSATVSGHTGNGTIHVTSAEKSAWNTNTVHTLGYSKSGTQHRLTGLNGLSGTLSCVFKATAAFNAGDTFTVDGTAYTVQLSNGEAAEANLFVSGATVLVVVDTVGKKVNFKAGGGLSNSKLALATATAADVLSGKTFYAGNKTLKTGAMATPYKMKTGTVLIETTSHNTNIQVNCGFQANYVMTWYYKSPYRAAAVYSNEEGYAIVYSGITNQFSDVVSKHCIAPSGNGFIIKNSYYLMPVNNDYLNYTAFGI